MPFLAGKGGAVTVDTNAWSLQEWSLEIQTNLIDVTTFTAGGYRVKLAGLTGARITARGPYDSGAMAMTSGNEYDFVLKVSNAVSFAVTALVGQIVIGTNVEGAAQVTVSAESTGSFTAAIT